MYGDIQPLELRVAENLSVYDPKGMGLFGRFDLIFINPPFGTKIPVDDPGILMNFDLGHRWVKDENSRWQKTIYTQASQPPEILFIERCYQFLKLGGKMAIVLPDGVLSNPDTEYVRYLTRGKEKCVEMTK